jgi:peptide/nickel transport system permease protein
MALEYIIKRLLLASLTLLVILFASYALLRLAPGDPTKSNMLNAGEAGNAVSAEKGGLRSNTAMREKLHLDRPVITGFGYWLKNVLKGDFGESVAVDPGRPVLELIAESLPVTLKLNIFAIILTYLVAIPIGVYSARYANSQGDQLTGFVLFVLYSLPVMWVGLLLQAFFCTGGMWEIFPLKGLVPANSERLAIWQLHWELLKCYALPVLCLSYGGLAALSRYARSGMIEALRGDYVRTARAKGVSENVLLWRHAFRNALITLITLFGGLLPALISGSVIVEYIFSIPGMGTLSLNSLSSRDYPLQMALFAIGGALTLGGIFLSDLLYTAADPRIRLESGAAGKN